MDWLGLKEEHKMLRHDIKRFAETELEPKVKDLDKEGKLHREAFEKIGKLGILGILVPEEYGGAGMDLLSLIVTLEELSRVSPSFALSVAAHNLFGDAVAVYGPAEMKGQYLPPLAEGKKTAGMGIQTMLCAAEEGSEKEHFVINGSFSQVFGFVVRGKEDTQFAVQENTGDIKPETGLMGMRASGISSFNPRTQSSNRSSFAMTNLAGFSAKMRLVLAAISCGICGSALAQSIAYAKERKQFDRPIASFGMVRRMLAEMAARTDASRMMVYQAAANGNDLDMNMGAAFAVEHALIVTDNGVQVFGGYGYTKDYPLEMFFRDAKMLEIFAGSAEYLKVKIGKELCT